MKNFNTVWVNGTMDVLHYGHIQLLKYAKSLGDTLIVGIDSDKRVKELKGDTRPVNNAMIRGQFLEAISGVALVVEFDTNEELENWIKELQVDIIVVGDEYINKRVIGSEYVKEVKYFKKLNGYSTTEILNNHK